MSQRLITLVTDPSSEDGKTGMFDALFNEEIIIKPNSEIALQSVSVNRAADFLIINANSNEIKFQIQNANVDGYGGERTILLGEGTYSKTNVLDLFYTIEYLMNTKLELGAAREFNCQIKVGINKEEKVEFEYRSTSSINFVRTPAANPICHYFGLSVSGTSHIYATTPSGFIRANYAYCKPEFIRSCGVVRGRIQSFTNTQTGTPAGMLLGLVEKTPENLIKLQTANFTQEDFYIGIRTNSSNLPTDPYEIKHPTSAGFSDSLLNPFKVDDDQTPTQADNDIMDITLENGEFKIIVRTSVDGGTNYVLQTTPFINDQSKSYIAVIGVFGNNTTSKLSYCSTSIDPYDISTFSAGTHEAEAFTVGAVPRPTPQLGNHVSNLIFQSLEMANFFGFDQVEQNISDVSKRGAYYVADSSFSLVLSTNTYLIELLNLSIDSYHSLAKGRKNILASVPISEKVISHTGQIQYEPNNLFFVALKNNYELTLRNIRARIISNDFSQIETEGLAELSLLIREKA